MIGTIGNALFFLASVGFIYVALRSRYARAYTAKWLQRMGVVAAFLGVVRLAEGTYAIAVIGKSPEYVLVLLSGFQFLIAAAFFVDAGRRRAAEPIA